jgi:hypothetical protein
MSHPIPPAEEPASLKLPDLNQATLDWPGVEALLRDIAACTQVTEIIPKAAAQGYVTDGVALTLLEARRLLQERAVWGVQIRYRYEGADWWDTLMVLPGGWRLVRIRHDFSAPPN